MVILNPTKVNVYATEVSVPRKDIIWFFIEVDTLPKCLFVNCMRSSSVCMVLIVVFIAIILVI